jgi:hypothetical protein
MCTIGHHRPDTDTTPLIVVGPRGLRAYIRFSLRLSYSYTCPFVVHELHTTPIEQHNIEKQLLCPHRDGHDEGASEQQPVDEQEHQQNLATVKAFDDAVSCASASRLEWEIPGLDIASSLTSDGSAYWNVPCDDERIESIFAAPLQHTVPYVFRFGELCCVVLYCIVSCRVVSSFHC